MAANCNTRLDLSISPSMSETTRFPGGSVLGTDLSRRMRAGLPVGNSSKDYGKKARGSSVRNTANFGSIKKFNGKKVNGINGNESPAVDRSMLWADENNISPVRAFKLGRFVEDKFVYRQNFVIRSYEIGPDRTATMETVMNLLQETALNHATSSGLAGERFGTTHEMYSRKLFWAVTKINLQVEKFSCWGDVVEIDTWVAPHGKNGLRRDWIIRDYDTHKIITKATSTWVTMNRETRRLCKIPEQVKEELEPFYLDRKMIVDTNNKIDKLNDETAENIKSGLAPRWSDMDINQHVNNVKYIGWILESVPMYVLQDYNLTHMELEYRRECRQSQLLESLTSMKAAQNEAYLENEYSSRADLASTHLLRMQKDKAEIVRARAEWQSKAKQK
ncbi:palmitoyl-acyl carrier protein thioesterase, chloroplastic-like [Aristolochia californica]|uniref:palmitoyl-acyl carrier protein thioesterase, chloroplastic-like n=1 Tax=Aristolochia californica TaxID=171875 RepID=UPI0035D684A4